jgi:hypothetical protein
MVELCHPVMGASERMWTRTEIVLPHKTSCLFDCGSLVRRAAVGDCAPGDSVCGLNRFRFPNFRRFGGLGGVGRCGMLRFVVLHRLDPGGFLPYLRRLVRGGMMLSLRRFVFRLCMQRRREPKCDNQG